MSHRKKQTACVHPPAHQQPTIDYRYEVCALCHTVHPAPVPAPWIVAYDATQPPAPPPLLFGMTEEQIAALMSDGLAPAAPPDD